MYDTVKFRLNCLEEEKKFLLSNFKFQYRDTFWEVSSKHFQENANNFEEITELLKKHD